jgi:hypothetical protein
MKEESFVPSALRRIILLAAAQLYVVNVSPPTTILPLFCTTRAATVLLNQLQILKPASCVPSVLRRIILFAATQLYPVKLPPTNILPSLCMARAEIEPLNQPQIMKEESLVPSSLRRIISFAAAQLYPVKLPPTTILPSPCTDRAAIVPLNQFQMLKPVSLVPSALRRIILLAATQLYPVKLPPTRILLFSKARVWTLLLNQIQILKEESFVSSVLRRVI